MQAIQRFFITLSPVFSLALVPVTFAANPPPTIPDFPTVSLSEGKLLELARESNPENKKIESRREAERAKTANQESQYQWSLEASGSHQETNERPLVPQVPIFSPQKVGELTVQKKFSYGVTTKFGIEAAQQSSAAIGLKNGTTSRVFAQADISLWKNLLGRLNRSRLASQKLSEARSEFMHEIETHQFDLHARKLYWSLVANQRSIAVIQELLTTAEQQLSSAKNRARNSIADQAEVARYEAQAANRKSQLLYQKFEQQSLLTQLRILIPELNAKNVEIQAVPVAKTQAEVMKCVDAILTEKGVPLGNSRFDEIIGILRMQKEASAVANNTIDDPELTLTTKLMTTGVGTSYGSSISDFSNDNRSGFQVGLTLTVPLSGESKRERDAALNRDNMALSAEEDEIQATMVAAHTAILQNINFLLQAVESQKSASDALRRRLQEVKRKYKQARVSDTELVNDQDDLLNSELSIVQTQLAILNSLFEYFEIFTETPCEFNRRAS